MYLLILESIGTAELLLVGIVALMVFGPRRMPEMIRKAGKLMAEFRKTTGEFKQSWEKEVNFEEEKKLLTEDIEITEKTIAKDTIQSDLEKQMSPEIREVSKDEFDLKIPQDNIQTIDQDTPDILDLPEMEETANIDQTKKETTDKRDWL